jgi:hypothetical protein
MDLKKIWFLVMFLSCGIASTITMTMLIWVGFVGGDWITWIQFNKYGEHWIEFIALNLSTIYSIYIMLRIYCLSDEKYKKLNDGLMVLWE